MGRFFFECPGGRLIFSCKSCGTFLTNIENVISDKFRGSTGPAYLFDSVINIELAGVEQKQMLTGKHMVRDAFCKNCKFRVGWMYEFAFNTDQVYKEGKVILEMACIRESLGIDEKLPTPTSSASVTADIALLSSHRHSQHIPAFSGSSSSSSTVMRNSASSSSIIVGPQSRNTSTSNSSNTSSSSSNSSPSTTPVEDRRGYMTRGEAGRNAGRGGEGVRFGRRSFRFRGST